MIRGLQVKGRIRKLLTIQYYTKLLFISIIAFISTISFISTIEWFANSVQKIKKVSDVKVKKQLFSHIGSNSLNYLIYL